MKSAFILEKAYLLKVISASSIKPANTTKVVSRFSTDTAEILVILLITLALFGVMSFLTLKLLELFTALVKLTFFAYFFNNEI